MNPVPAALDARRRDASRRAVAAHGTPVYLLDWDEVKAQAAAFQAAFPGALCLYAMKANPLLAVLGRLAALGWGFEAVSLGELERAARAAPGAPVVLNGPGKTREALERATELGAVVAVDALDEIERLPRGARVLLRVNPGLEPRTHPHLATGAAGSKFGLRPADLDAALASARARGLDVLGLQAHVGSLIQDRDDYALAWEVLASLSATTGPLPVLDAGGGFGPDLDLADVAPLAFQAAAAFGARLWLEPGRRLVATAGWLVARVQSVKRTARPFVILDAGMTELIRPMLYGAEHPVVALDPRAGQPGAWTVGGPACESGDLLAETAWLTDPRPGDLIAVLQAGAYGSSMASPYLTRGRPPEALLEGETLTLARRRESVEDLLRLETP